MIALALFGCTSDPDTHSGDHHIEPDATGDTSVVTPPTDTGVTALPGPEVVSGPTLRANRSGEVMLTAWLDVSTDVPCQLELVIDDGYSGRRITFPDLTTIHTVPLLGMRGDVDVRVTPTLVGERGQRTELAEEIWRPAPIARLLPELEVLTHEAGRLEPGWTVLPLDGTDPDAVWVAIDAEGVPVWAWDVPKQTKGITWFGSAEFVTVTQSSVVHRNAMGDLLARHAENTGLTFHHDVVPTTTGTLLALSKDPVAVTSYPSGYGDPYALGPADLKTDTVIELDPAGTTLGVWRTSDLLDTSRIGYGAVGAPGEDNDWTHGNAVLETPNGDGFWLSFRHQDAVVEVGRDGGLRWILANHDGWSTEFQPMLLTPIGTDFSWPYHQHSPARLDDGDGVRVLMFDNGNEARTTPYSRDPHPDGDFSRIVEYRIDPIAMTIEQTFEMVGDGVGGTLFSGVMGNADYLPETGNMLATYTSLTIDGAQSNGQLGWGTRSTRVIEVDPLTGDVVWDLRVRSEQADSSEGWRADRVVRLQSLYQDLATVEWLSP